MYNYLIKKHLLALLLIPSGVFLSPLSLRAETLEGLLLKHPELRAVIAAHLAKGAVATVPETRVSCTLLTSPLRLGAVHSEVRTLQALLNQDKDTQVASAGPGSAGNESKYFGLATLSAVMRFQLKYAKEILVPNGLLAPTGVVGGLTRAKLNTLCSRAEDTGEVLGLTTDIPATPALPIIPVVQVPRGGGGGGGGGGGAPAPRPTGLMQVEAYSLPETPVIKSGIKTPVLAFHARASGTAVTMNELTLSVLVTGASSTSLANFLSGAEVLMNGAVVGTVGTNVFRATSIQDEFQASVAIAGATVPLGATSSLFEVRTQAIAHIQQAQQGARLSFQVSNIGYVDVSGNAHTLAEYTPWELQHGNVVNTGVLISPQVEVWRDRGVTTSSFTSATSSACDRNTLRCEQGVYSASWAFGAFGESMYIAKASLDANVKVVQYTAGLATTTGTVSLGDLTSSAPTRTIGGVEYYEIADGASVTFAIESSLVVSTSGVYGLGLDSIAFAYGVSGDETALASTSTYQFTPVADFKTGEVYIDAPLPEAPMEAMLIGSVSENSPSGAVVVNETDPTQVTLLSFRLKAENANIALDGINIDASGLGQFTTDLRLAHSGAVLLSTSTEELSGVLTLDDSYLLPAGETHEFSIVVDVVRGDTPGLSGSTVSTALTSATASRVDNSSPVTLSDIISGGILELTYNR